jgi:hypothetical protein
VHDHGVALADKGEHRLELRALGVFAGGLIDEEAIDGDLIELALGVLLESADSNIPDALSRHAISGEAVRLKSMTLDGVCQSMHILILDGPGTNLGVPVT